jgi:hypothetical protein
VLDLCLEHECKICGVQITNFLQRKDHYQGSKHDKKVALELNEIFENSDEIPSKKPKIDLNLSAEMFLKKIENEVSRDTSNLTMGDFKLLAWQKEWLEGWDLPLPPQIISMCRITKCDICDTTFTSVIMAQAHFEGKNHEKKLKVRLATFCQQYGLETPKRLADTAPLNETFCSLCDVQLSSAIMARLHYAGKQHTKKREKAGIEGVIEDETGRFGIGGGFYKNASQQNEVEGDDLKEVLQSAAGEDGMDGTWADIKLKEQQTFQSEVRPNFSSNHTTKNVNQFFCQMCNLDLTSQADYDSHINGKNHKKKENLMNPQRDAIKQEGIEGNNFKEVLKSATADEDINGTWANVKLKQQQTFQSEVSPNVSFSFPIKEFNPFLCKICNIDLSSQANYNSHINGKSHKKKENSLDQTQNGEFFCDVCNIQVTSQVTFEAHIRGKQHAKKAGGPERHNFHCEVCNVSTTDQNGMTNHLNGKIHLRKINSST